MLYFPILGSFWNGARNVCRPGPRQAELHMDSFHVAHIVACRFNGGDCGDDGYGDEEQDEIHIR